MAPHNEMSLAEAAMQLGLSWHTAWSRVLTGALVGRKDERGKWRVTTASVARFKRKLNATTTALRQLPVHVTRARQFSGKGRDDDRVRQRRRSTRIGSRGAT